MPKTEKPDVIVFDAATAGELMALGQQISQLAAQQQTILRTVVNMSGEKIENWTVAPDGKSLMRKVKKTE